MIPQDRRKLLISFLFLIFGGHVMVSQNALAHTYQTLQMNQPDFFEVKSDSLNTVHDGDDSSFLISDSESGDEKDPYRRNRLSLNLAIAASSIYQGIVLSHVFSKKETVGTPPSTFDIYNRTPLGMAFPFLFSGGMSIGAVMNNAGKPIQPGLSSMYMYGSFIGLVHGTFIGTSFTDINASGYNRTMAFWGGAISLAEGMWLTNFAKKNKLTSPEINFSISSNFYGGIVGAGLGGIISNTENQAKVISLGLTAGSIGGTILSKYLIKNRSLTNGDLTFINAASALGLFMGLSINIHSENRLMTSMGYITSIGSTFAGSYFLTKYYPFTSTDGLKITLGTGVGILTGMGFSLAVQSRTFHNVIFSMVSGAILGFAGTTYHIMKSNQTGNQLIYRHKKSKNRLSYNFNPNGLVLNLQSQDAQLRMMQSGVNVNLLQLQYRF